MGGARGQRVTQTTGGSHSRGLQPGGSGGGGSAWLWIGSGVGDQGVWGRGGSLWGETSISEGLNLGVSIPAPPRSSATLTLERAEGRGESWASGAAQITRGLWGREGTFREELQDAGTGGFIAKGARKGKVTGGAELGVHRKQRHGGGWEEAGWVRGRRGRRLRSLCQTPTATPAWALLLPVEASLGLAQATRWVGKPSPESCICLQGSSLRHLEG